ncbi:MAG: DUF6869 domain-containing protein [Stappiaceae bacterium]
MRNISTEEISGESVEIEEPTDREMQSSDCIDEMISNNPEASLLFLYAALSQCQSALDISVLAAGPLENLLQAHGPAVIDNLEKKAGSSEKMRYFLSGTWGKDRIDPDIWRRLTEAVSQGPVMSVDDPRDPGFGLDCSRLVDERSLAILLNEDASILH